MKPSDKLFGNFSKHLFWDVNKSELNHEKHTKYIITKVLQYGFIEDWKILKRYYGLDKITDVAVKIRDLDKKTAAFLALLSKVSKQNFACYSTKQSTQKPWNF